MQLVTVIYIFAIWNIFVCLLFAIDKLKAKNQKWRIPENVLLFTSLVFGGVGGVLGMVLFHHKVAKIKFRLGVSLALVLVLIVLIGGVQIGIWSI